MCFSRCKKGNGPWFQCKGHGQRCTTICQSRNRRCRPPQWPPSEKSVLPRGANRPSNSWRTINNPSVSQSTMMSYFYSRYWRTNNLFKMVYRHLAKILISYQSIRRGGPIEDYYLISWYNFSHLLLEGMALSQECVERENLSKVHCWSI